MIVKINGTEYSCYERANKMYCQKKALLGNPPGLDIGDKYYHIRLRAPEQFVKIRTPDWAERVADSIIEGAEVRTGKLPSGEWKIQSVMIPKTVDTMTARELAIRIKEKIER